MQICCKRKRKKKFQYLLFDYFLFAGCFGDGIFVRGQSQNIPYLFIHSEYLPCTTTSYYFRMFFHNRVNSSTSDLVATVRNEFVPDIDIYCQKNCGDKVNPSERLVQVADCPNCWDIRIRNQVKYVWEILDPPLNISDITSPGESDAAMIIAADALENNVTYSFNVTGKWAKYLGFERPQTWYTIQNTVVVNTVKIRTIWRTGN